MRRWSWRCSRGSGFCRLILQRLHVQVPPCSPFRPRNVPEPGRAQHHGRLPIRDYTTTWVRMIAIAAKETAAAQLNSDGFTLIADAGPCQGNKKKWLCIIVLFHYSKAFLRLKLLAFWMLRRNRFSNQLEQRAFDVIKSSRTGFICRATSAKNKRHAIASKWVEKPAQVFLG